MKKGFFKKNLLELLGVCESLLEPNKNPLVIFTLRGLFSDLYDFFENEPVDVSEAKILTADLESKIEEILDNIDNANLSSLEDLILLYLSNKTNLRS